MRFEVVTAGLVAVALALGAASLPGTAQGEADKPTLAWPDGKAKTVYANLLLTGMESCSFHNISTDVDNRFYFHALESDRCTSSGLPPTIQTTDRGVVYEVHLQPPPEKPIPLIKGAPINITLHVKHEGATDALDTLNSFNVGVRLGQDKNFTEMEVTGVVEDPTTVTGGSDWNSWTFEISNPLDAIGTNPKAPFTLEIWSNVCGPLTGVNATCLADQGGLNTVGWQWWIGYEADRQTTLDLPIPSAFEYGKPWPPLNCGPEEVENLTSETCDPIPLPTCGPGEELDEANRICIPLPDTQDDQNNTNGPGNGGVGPNTGADNNTTNEADTPSVGLVAILAATSLAVVALRRRRDA